MAGKTPTSRQVVSSAHGELEQKGEARVDKLSVANRIREQDITDRQQAAVRERASQQLLLAITRAQALFIDEAKPEAVFDAILQELLSLTDSEYGFIGEVLWTAERVPFLRMHAITDIAWNEETKALMAQQAPTLEFRNLQTLFGQVMTTGRPVISNDPQHDPRAGGLPPGHPPMHAFLGLPIYRGELLTGMVGIANRSDGYDDTGIAYLEPFLATCAQLLEGYRNRRLRTEAEAALRRSEERWQLVVRGSHDGIWDWDLTSNEVYFSPRWKEMLGYDDHEILSDYQEWESRLHPEDRERVCSQLTAYLKGRIAQYHVEFRLRKKNGEYGWIQARGKAMWDAEGRPYRMAGFHTDITDRKREDALQAAEKQALELVAKGAGLSEVLMSICRTIEAHTAPMLTSIMLVTEDGEHLRCVASPSLPEDYNRAVDGISIGPTVGSCGSAAYYGKPSIVVDIEGDLLWKDYVQLTRAHGLRACWSQPILNSTGTVLGTFAAYYKEPRTPNLAELAVVERVGHLAAMAIQHIKMSEALRESEARFQAFMTHSPAVSFIKDSSGRHLYVNPTFERLFGVSLSEIRGKTLDGWLPSDVVAQLRANDEKVLTSGKPIEVEETVPTPDGMSQHWLVLKFPLISLSGELLLGGMAIDITARKQAEAALRESEERFRVIADTAPVLIWMAGLDKRCTYFNAGWLQYTGRTMEQELGDGWAEGVHPKDFDRCLHIYSEAFDCRESFNMEYRLRKADGQYGWIHDNGVPRFFPDGTFAGYLGACIDITARKMAEESLQRTRFAMDQAVDAVYWIDPNARILYTNDAASVMLGYTPDEFLRMTVHDLNPDFPPEVWPGWWAETREKKVISLETVHLTKDGRRIPIDIRVSFLAYGGQEFHCAFVRDITIRKQAEAALRRVHEELEQRVSERTIQLVQANRSLQEEIAERKCVEDRLRTTQYAVDHAADQIFVIGPNGYFLDVNESACRRLGYTKQELLTMSVMDIDPDFQAGVWEKFWAEISSSKRIRLETRHRSKSGEIYPVEVVANYLQHAGRELDYAIVRDISERKRAEEAVRDSELRYKLLTEATFDGVAIHDQGILLEVNAGLERMFGYGPGELIGRSILDLVADESRDQVVANMRGGVSGPYEAMGRRKDGTTFPGEIVVRPYCYRGKNVRLVAGRDITERKRLEVQLARHTEELEHQIAERTSEIAKLEARRAQTEKLAAMGRLAAGVAHEINNPIAGIKNAFTLVKQAVDPTHPHAEFVGMIDREIARVASIVQNMYQLYRPESGKGEPVELQIMMKDIETLFAKRLQQRRLMLAIDVDSCVHWLRVPRRDLLQVLLNLLNNAIDCSSEGGRITLTVRVEPDAIRMAVSDQGPGIPPENLPHIFDPFFTTKTGGDQKGMGLGLSISQSLVMAMGGKIEVQTQPNGGSTFSVLLPRHMAMACAQDRLDTINKEVMPHD